MVQVGGIRVGRVDDVSLVESDGGDDKVMVTFDIDKGVDFGPESRASIEVLNLLGEKYLDLQPAGEGQMAENAVIPLDRTESAYDIVGVFSDLTTTTERIDTDRLAKALDVVGDTTDKAAPEIEAELPRHRPALADAWPRATSRSRRS